MNTTTTTTIDMTTTSMNNTSMNTSTDKNGTNNTNTTTIVMEDHLSIHSLGSAKDYGKSSGIRPLKEEPKHVFYFRYGCIGGHIVMFYLLALLVLLDNRHFLTSNHSNNKTLATNDTYYPDVGFHNVIVYACFFAIMVLICSPSLIVFCAMTYFMCKCVYGIITDQKIDQTY